MNSNTLVTVRYGDIKAIINSYQTFVVGVSWIFGGLLYAILKRPEKTWLSFLSIGVGAGLVLFSAHDMPNTLEVTHLPIARSSLAVMS